MQDSIEKMHAKLLHQQANTQETSTLPVSFSSCFRALCSCWVHSVLYVSPEIYIFLFIQMQEFEKWLYQNPEIMDNVFGWQCPSPEGEIIN